MYCWFIMTMGLCKHFVHNALLARYAKCLHRPIVIINQQYTKGEIHFINICTPCSCWSCVRAQVHMFIYGLYRSIYKFHGHLIPSHTKRVVAEWWERWTCNLEAVRGVSNPTVGKIFVMFTCSVFLAAGLAAFKWNQTWHSSEVIGA